VSKKLISLCSIVSIFFGSVMANNTSVSAEQRIQIMRSKENVEKSSSIIQTAVPVACLTAFANKATLKTYFVKYKEMISKEFNETMSDGDSKQKKYEFLTKLIGRITGNNYYKKAVSFATKDHPDLSFIAASALAIWLSNKYFNKKAVEAVDTRNIDFDDED